MIADANRNIIRKMWERLVMTGNLIEENVMKSAPKLVKNSGIIF